jgi:amidohydrolase family protein
MLLVAWGLVASLAADGRAQSLVVRGGTLIDGTGRPPIDDAVIVVRDGTIVDVGRAPAEPGGTGTVVDARGKYILPGLIDSHIHYRDWETEPFLAYGVTTVNDLGNPFQWQSALKHGFNSGRMRGPRFFFCGEVLLPGEEAAEQQRAGILRRGGVIHKPEEAVGIVAHLKENGANCLKLSENFTGELFTPLAQAARAAGFSVISHSWNVTHSIQWGIGGVEHMEGVAVATASSPRAKEAVARLHLEAGHKNSALYQWMEPSAFGGVIRDLLDHHVFLNPTLAFEWKALHDHMREHEADDLRLYAIPALSYVTLDDRLVILGQYHWPDSRTAGEIRQYTEGYRKVQQFIGEFVRAGGKIYAGTDSSAATTPGLSLHHEMQLLVDSGLTPMQAILSATSWSAEIVGIQETLGTIEKGKIGDLVIVDADPLRDITNTKKIFKVIKDGRIVDTSFHADYELAIKRPGPESKHLYNPAPLVRDIVPSSLVEGASAKVRVLGRGFTPTSVVKLAGRALDTRWIGPTELEAALTAAHTARAGMFLLSVETPKPGGGASPPVEFMITFE